MHSRFCLSIMFLLHILLVSFLASFSAYIFFHRTELEIILLFTQSYFSVHLLCIIYLYFSQIMSFSSFLCVIFFFFCYLIYFVIFVWLVFRFFLLYLSLHHLFFVFILYHLSEPFSDIAKNSARKTPDSHPLNYSQHCSNFINPILV